MARGLLPFDFAKEIEVSEHAQIPSTSNGELNKLFPRIEPRTNGTGPSCLSLPMLGSA